MTSCAISLRRKMRTARLRGMRLRRKPRKGSLRTLKKNAIVKKTRMAPLKVRIARFTIPCHRFQALLVIHGALSRIVPARKGVRGNQGASNALSNAATSFSFLLVLIAVLFIVNATWMS